jgi:hypothetical protein
MKVIKRSAEERRPSDAFGRMFNASLHKAWHPLSCPVEGSWKN